MAVEARLTEQMPWVGTKTHKEIVEQAARTRRVSKATVMREALDHVYGLEDGELPDGRTIEDALESGAKCLGGS